MTASAPGHQACPACGVAVVPGYVRCPKCHASLPFGTGRSKRTTADPGGTSVEATRPAGLPVLPIVAALAIGGAIALVLALHGRRSAASAAVTPGVSIAPAADTTAAPIPVATPPPAPISVIAPSPPTSPTTPTTPNVNALADTLDQTLKHQRLWSTVSVRGPVLEIRSALCSDPGVAAAVSDVRAGLRAGGLARWRCIEESGQLVFEREL
jgi:hypothetical protein